VTATVQPVRARPRVPNPFAGMDRRKRDLVLLGIAIALAIG
jgi:hypothetical protein